MNDDALTNLTLQLGDLHISIQRARPAAAASDDAVLPDLGRPLGAAAATAPAGAPALSSTPAPPLRPAGRRFYAVTNDKVPHLLGVHCCQWAHLERQLPAGRLAGSGVRLHGFDDLSAATQHFRAKRGLPEDATVPVHCPNA